MSRHLILILLFFIFTFDLASREILTDKDYQLRIFGQKFAVQRKLTKNKNNQLTLEKYHKSTLIKYREVSQFEIENGNVIPLSYSLKIKSLFYNKNVSIDFDYDNRQITVIGKKTKTHAMPNNVIVHDPLSYQHQLTEDLRSQRQDLSYLTVDEKNIETYTFKVINEDNNTLLNSGIIQLKFERNKGDIDIYFIKESLTLALLQISKKNQELRLKDFKLSEYLKD